MPEPWTARIEAEFAADNLTRGWRDALIALASFRGHHGDLYPSQASVAARAQCSERTVRRAVAMAVHLGLMVVLPRRRWSKGRYVRQFQPLRHRRTGPRRGTGTAGAVAAQGINRTDRPETESSK